MNYSVEAVERRITQATINANELLARYHAEMKIVLEWKTVKASRLCPFKIGEILTYKVHWGYSHPPKIREKKVKILKILPDWGDLGYELWVVNIKKDGTEGKQKRLYSWDIGQILKEREKDEI